MKKSQASIEGIFIVGAVFIMFLFLISYGFERGRDNKNTESFISERDNCLKISDLIMGVFINGNSTQVISKVDYEFNLLPDSRLIGIYHLTSKSDLSYYTNAKTVFCTIPINQFGPGGGTVIHSGDIKLINTGDFVVVSNA